MGVFPLLEDFQGLGDNVEFIRGMLHRGSFLSPDSITSCVRRPASGPPRRRVMEDLDLSLMQAAKQRCQALAKNLKSPLVIAKLFETAVTQPLGKLTGTNECGRQIPNFGLPTFSVWEYFGEAKKIRTRAYCCIQRGDNLSAPSSPATARNDCSITPLTPSPSPRVEVRPRMSCPFSVVVAIDFGTTSSGYAFSFTQDSEAIHMMKRWEGGDPGVANQKSPTCLLLTPDLRFHSFGFAARDFYHDLDPEEARHWLYFDKFKMKIHSTSDLTMETELEAVNGRRVRAIEVFAHALHFFREHALKEVKDQSSSVLEGEEIRWVITVPAVWRQPAKQFMREAAYLAGLVSPDCPEQLLIALEPEAASIYCRKLRLHQVTGMSLQTVEEGQLT
ncbi:Heat shock 70 kDa protein 12B [Larimichthys crocea]|uniref:Uncharacterized protein n=1 Tax=Larimichthys crocea TaxID=215358 RepID=A0ACD3Q581_LARCR|nr:Heat shock 70 kDa protein 12B [Larimichthys crocea]